MWRGIVIIRDMKSPTPSTAPAVDIDRCDCSRCAPGAPRWKATHLLGRVLIGAVVGAVACAKGLYLAVPPALARAVSAGVAFYIIWALTGHRLPARSRSLR